MITVEVHYDDIPSVNIGQEYIVYSVNRTLNTVKLKPKEYSITEALRHLVKVIMHSIRSKISLQSQ